ncbi:LytTR family DNA-binding domain-containing protein [Longimicrobium sp.]|uniref:LytR/AlgR family response regulator transcription factor n=1 Tax=Longimicrobium sp. TaxID=2029185 RepID=UPI002C6160E6|nr:LytTR family DNA-binding domain-containing protein [Longimicrobium sp.]HSU14403.1 LytTR family DNA-binding domain-containing protein [Longimicrobium sp.]
MTAPLRVLIVDDELLARQRLEDLLARESDVAVAGAASDGDEAVEAIRTLRPDVVFLDVQMPGKTGMEVVREIGPDRMPVTVFVTAYDQFALQAFDVAAVDYLLKPYDDERFEQAFRRARKLAELSEVERLAGRLRTLLGGGAVPASASPAAATDDPLPGAAASSPAPAPASPWTERIAVEMRGQVRVVPVSQIEYITASGPYAELHTSERGYVIRERMQALEERLDPARFLRIHRSIIVRLDVIDTLLRGGGGDYAVRLKNGVKLKVARTRVEELERRMGVGR